MELDENVPSNLLLADDAPVAASASTAKTPLPASKRAAAQTARATKSTARTPAASSAAASSTAATPIRGSKAATVSCVAGLGTKDAVAALVKSATAAVQVGTANWSHQDSFVHSLKEALAGNKEVAAGLAEHAHLIVSALATCQTCGRSGTQTETLHVWQSLFETPVLRKRLDAHLDVAFHAIVSIVAHNSSAFLHTAACDTMLAAMRCVNAAKMALNLCKEINTDKHDKNVPKMTALAGLAADGMEMLVHGCFPRLDETAPGASSGPLQELPQKIAYYKDILCAIVKLDKLPHASHRACAARMLRCVATKGEANHTLVAMVREVRGTNRSVEQHFVTMYREITGIALAAVTNGAATTTAAATNAAPATAAAAAAASVASSPCATTRRAGSLTNTTTTTNTNVASSPLPASARKKLGAGGKHGWAATMPKEILSPGPVMQQMQTQASQLSTATHALPSRSDDHDHEHADYNTLGAGLLDDVTGGGSGRTSLCFNYSPRASMMVPSAASAAAAAAEVPVERQLQFAANGDAEAEADEDEESNVVLINHAASSSLAAAAGAAAMVDEASSALDVTRTPPSASSVAAAAAASSALNTSVVYNYNRGSMMAEGGIGATAPAGLLSLTSPAPAAAAKTRSRSSGQKRKADGSDELPSSAAEMSAQSPNSKLVTIKALTQQLKKQKGDAGAAVDAQAQGHTLSTAVQLLSEVQSAYTAKVSAQLADQSQFWASKRAKLKVKRSNAQH